MASRSAHRAGHRRAVVGKRHHREEHGPTPRDGPGRVLHGERATETRRPALLQRLPRDHQIDRRVAEGQAAEVEHGGEATGFVEQQVLDQQVAVVPGPGALDRARRLSGEVPHAQSGVDVQVDAEVATGSRRLARVASSSCSGRPRYQASSASSSAPGGTSMARSWPMNLGEVLGQSLGRRGSRRRDRGPPAGQPPGDRPLLGVAEGRLAEVHDLRHGDVHGPADQGQPGRLLGDGRASPGLARQTHGEVVTQAEQRVRRARAVGRPRAPDRPRQATPRRRAGARAATSTASSSACSGGIDRREPAQKRRARSSSAICTALRAAPLRRLSPTTNSVRPRPPSTVGSVRMRPT